MNGFGKTLAGSVILHAALLAAAAFLFASGANRVFITPVYTVDLVAQGPRPGPAPSAEAVKEEPAPAQPVQATPKAEPVKVSPEALKVKEKPSVNDALKKIEKNVERRKDEALVASSIDDLKKKMEAARQARNERVSKLKEEIGSRATPKAASPSRPQTSTAQNPAGGAAKADLERKYPAYYGVIRDKVQDSWIYPEGLKDDKISVIVSIKIARTGKLLDVSVEKSSGDQAFDASLLKAVKKAAPFPPLPVDLEGSFLETGLRFCPGCAQ
jgi:TonB family protein